MKTVISTNAAPGAIGPYSQAIDTGSMLFASGQIPINPATGEIPEGIKAQAAQSLANVKAILAAAGLTLHAALWPCVRSPRAYLLKSKSSLSAKNA